MAATGNEVPTFDQLKDYISFASDEDATAYFEASDEEASAETGQKVLTAAQLKSIAASLGGGGSSGDESVVLFEGSTTIDGASNNGLHLSQNIAEFSRLEVTVEGQSWLLPSPDTLTLNIDKDGQTYLIYIRLTVPGSTESLQLQFYAWTNHANYLYIDSYPSTYSQGVWVAKVVGYK